MAALGFENLTAEPTTVMVESAKADFAICTLQAGKIPQQALDLNFTEGEEVKFFLEGNGGVIHLTAVNKSTPHRDTNQAVVLIIPSKGKRVAVPVDALIVYSLSKESNTAPFKGSNIFRYAIDLCGALDILQPVILLKMKTQAINLPPWKIRGGGRRRYTHGLPEEEEDDIHMDCRRRKKTIYTWIAGGGRRRYTHGLPEEEEDDIRMDGLPEHLETAYMVENYVSNNVSANLLPHSSHLVASPLNATLKKMFSSGNTVLWCFDEDFTTSTFYNNEEIYCSLGQEACLALDVALASGGCEAIVEGFYSVVKAHTMSGGQ
eukprot:gene10136-11171_t